ncbi:hypothetical protein MFRU_005g03000 [Monilinia fructicola]|nr:hypothetical protein MFRU_005g03000 [Monilinia fructicola]
MDLSNFTAKALEKVEKYSLILYATGYFTQEEWVKHDASIHKGKYVFTNGPQASPPTVFGLTIAPWDSNASPTTRDESRPDPQNEVEESLINFDECAEEKAEAAVASTEPIDVTTTNNTDENGVGDVDIGFQNSQPEVSLVSSSQEGGSEASASLINENIRTENETIVPANLDEPVTTNQEQEPEGSGGIVKSLPKDTIGNENPTTSPADASPAKLDLPSKVNEESTERSTTPKARISVSPTTKNETLVSTGKLSSWSPNGPRSMELSRTEEEYRIRRFTKAFGRAPNARSDYYQPSNPEFKPRWLMERSPDSTPSTSKPVASSKLISSASIRPKFPKKEPIAHVNKWPIAKATSKKSDDSRTILKKSGGFSMNDYERTCAAEWENDSEENGPSSRLDRSRFAALADVDHQSFRGSTESDSTVSSQKNGQARDAIGWRSSTDTMVDDKELKITKDRLKKSNNSPLDLKSTNTRERLRSKPLEIVVPKTEVCYFWALGDRCRYPEELCRDLHEDREYTLHTNVRDGKPNPGPLCEVVDPIPAPPSGKSHIPSGDPAATVGKRFTCFFWHQGSCWKFERECLFLHTYVGSEGILHRKVQLQAHKNKKRPLITRPQLEDTNEGSVDAEWGAGESIKYTTSGAEPGLRSSGHGKPANEEEKASLEPGSLKWPGNQYTNIHEDLVIL